MSAKLIEVIVVEQCRGRGTECDPCRVVYEYWSTEGDLLAVFDARQDNRFDHVMKVTIG